MRVLFTVSEFPGRPTFGSCLTLVPGFASLRFLQLPSVPELADICASLELLADPMALIELNSFIHACTEAVTPAAVR